MGTEWTDEEADVDEPNLTDEALATIVAAVIGAQQGKPVQVSRWIMLRLLREVVRERQITALAAELERVMFPAETYCVGDFITEELAARGWDIEVLARNSGITPLVLSGIIAGYRAVTDEEATGLGHAFDTSAAYWLGLQRQHDTGAGRIR